MKNIMSIDVEEWFNIIGVDNLEDPNNWDTLPSRVRIGFTHILELLDKTNTKATFFFVGWLAKKQPELVKLVSKLGHEVASHTMYHRDFRRIGPKEAIADLRESKEVLEDITGNAVKGVRLPGAALNSQNLDVLRWIVEAGYEYDSSITPGISPYGGLPAAPTTPFKIIGPDFELYEFPNTTIGISRYKVKFSGGTYFRLMPYPAIYGATKFMNIKNTPVMVYIHPRDLDTEQPRDVVKFPRSLWHYYGLNGARKKLHRYLKDFTFTSCEDFFATAQKENYFEKHSVTLKELT